jgi:hypothetical protein
LLRIAQSLQTMQSYGYVLLTIFFR